MSYKIKLSLLSPKCMMTERLSEDVLKKGQPLSDWWRVRWCCHWSPVHPAPTPPAKGLSGDWAGRPHWSRRRKRDSSVIFVFEYMEGGLPQKRKLWIFPQGSYFEAHNEAKHRSLSHVGWASIFKRAVIRQKPEGKTDSVHIHKNGQFMSNISSFHKSFFYWKHLILQY